jgi:hypothetical protein
MKHQLSVVGMPNADLPIFEEKQGKEWVSYGKEDQYGDYLLNLYLNSSIHSAIVNGIGEMIYGYGLHARDWERDAGTKEQWLRVNKLLEASDPDVLKRAASDLKLYGQTYLNVIWNVPRTKVVQLKHLPVHTMRAGVADEKGKVYCYYYKADWTKGRTRPQAIKAFCMEDRTEASTCLQIKRYTPGFHYYGLPDYEGSTGYIDLDQQVQRFHLNNIKNGLFPSMLLSFNNGQPTDDEAQQIESAVLDKFSGSEGAGRVMITFSDGTDRAPSITPVNANAADGMYEHLSKEVTNKILSGHRVTSPLLFGVRGDGTGFGSNAQEMVDAYSLLHHSVVVPFQELLLEGLGPIFETLGVSLDLYFKPLKPAGFLAIEEGAADVTQSYTGMQVSSALDIIAKQVIGELSKEQAIQLLITMLGFPADTARTLFDTQGTAVAEPQQVELSGVLEALLLEGEDPDPDYELIDVREVDYDQEEAHDALWKFATISPSGPGGSSDQDRPLIKVRYRYAPEAVDTTGNPSRDFCRSMVSAGKVYTKEAIEKAGRNGVNPGFGYRGSDSYNVFFYKGGPRCRHYWERATFLRKNNQEISVNQARKLITSLPVKERDAQRLPVNPRQVAQLPNDMRYKGYHPNNKNRPKDAR